MRRKCEYCKSYVSEYDETCPNCGAVNSNYMREAKEAPKTIEELKQWYIDRNLPPEKVTRFFIGTNYKFSKAFGIYKDEKTGNFVVYKNKSNGERSVRYEGKDEAYAVNELYQKLKYEITNQKYANAERQSRKRNQPLGSRIIIYITVFILGFGTALGLYYNRFARGYYYYDGTYYYQQGGDWYVYDHTWRESKYVPDDLKKNSKDYYESFTYYSSYGTSDFSHTTYYKEYEEYWDSSSDWDSGSDWDSSSTDWDSDW